MCLKMNYHHCWLIITNRTTTISGSHLVSRKSAYALPSRSCPRVLQPERLVNTVALLNKTLIGCVYSVRQFRLDNEWR